jgi:hypothetical protein
MPELRARTCGRTASDRQVGTSQLIQGQCDLQIAPSKGASNVQLPHARGFDPVGRVKLPNMPSVRSHTEILDLNHMKADGKFDGAPSQNAPDPQ